MVVTCSSPGDGGRSGAADSVVGTPSRLQSPTAPAAAVKAGHRGGDTALLWGRERLLVPDWRKMGVCRGIWLVVLLHLLAETAVRFLAVDGSSELHPAGARGMDEMKFTDRDTSIRVMKKENCFLVENMDDCE